MTRGCVRNGTAGTDGPPGCAPAGPRAAAAPAAASASPPGRLSPATRRARTGASGELRLSLCVGDMIHANGDDANGARNACQVDTASYTRNGNIAVGYYAIWVGVLTRLTTSQ